MGRANDPNRIRLSCKILQRHRHQEKDQEGNALDVPHHSQLAENISVHSHLFTYIV